MEDNLLASIFRANDRIEECLKQPLNLPLSIEEMNENSLLENQNASQLSNHSQNNHSNTVPTKEDEYGYEERYVVSIIGVKQMKNHESLVTKSTYISYEISVTRISDGFTKSVFRRFREIRALYKELIESNDEVAENGHIVFPDYTEGWFGSAQIDPESELVQRRKSDLQCFFFELFHHFPVLFHHKKVIDFLELKNLPAKSHSTFSMHYAKKVDVDVELSEELTSDIVYNPKTGRLENVKVPAATQSHNNVSCVEFLTHAERFPRKKVKPDNQ